jgi:hypothetical protein
MPRQSRQLAVELRRGSVARTVARAPSAALNAGKRWNTRQKATALQRSIATTSSNAAHSEVRAVHRVSLSRFTSRRPPKHDGAHELGIESGSVAHSLLDADVLLLLGAGDAHVVVVVVPG